MRVKLTDVTTIAASTFIGNNTGGATNPIALTAAQSTALLNTFTTSLKGLVPSPGSSTGKYLKDDGTWDTPAGGGGGSGFTTTATGTGSSQNVTMAASVSSPNDVYVFVNGLYQIPTTDYTVSGTTLTITTPNSGDSIVISKPAGSTGAQGNAGTIAVGTVTTGSAGSSVVINNVGTSSAAILDFTIPRGDTGTAATIAVGTVTTGSAGTSVIINNSGSSSAATFDFTIPRGDTGAAGTNAILGWTGGLDGVMADAETIMLGAAPAAITLVQGNCKAMAMTGATGSTTLTIKKKANAAGSPSTIGTIVFSAGGSGGPQDGTVTITSASVSSGDFVYIEGPATADTTLANIAFMIKA